MIESDVRRPFAGFPHLSTSWRTKLPLLHVAHASLPKSRLSETLKMLVRTNYAHSLLITLPVDVAQSGSAPLRLGRAHRIQGSKALQSVQLAESIRLGLGLRVSLTVKSWGLRAISHLDLVIIDGEPLFTPGQ